MQPSSLRISECLNAKPVGYKAVGVPNSHQRDQHIINPWPLEKDVLDNTMIVPDEVTPNIMEYISTEDLLKRGRYVCKRWYDDASFIVTERLSKGFQGPSYMMLPVTRLLGPPHNLVDESAHRNAHNWEGIARTAQFAVQVLNREQTLPSFQQQCATEMSRTKEVADLPCPEETARMIVDDYNYREYGFVDRL